MSREKAIHANGGSLILRGDVNLSTACVFGDVVNYATVYNYVYESVVTDWTGDVVNYGTLANHPWGGSLILYCRKDLTNYGTIAAFHTYIAGTQNQRVINTGSVTGNGLTMVSEIGPAIWLFNGNIMNPDNPQTEVGLNPNLAGIWQPVNAQSGRLITVGNLATGLSAPTSLVISFSGPEVKLRWNQGPNAVYYKVYYSADPEAAFPADWEGSMTVFDEDLADGVVRFSPGQTAPHRIFRVTAGN